MSDKVEVAVSLDTVLAEILTKAVAGVETAGEFIIGEIPLVAQEALLYYGVYHFIMMILGIVLLVLIVINGFNVAKVIKEDKWSGDAIGIYCVVSICGSIIMFMVSTCALMNMTWLKIWLAPKIWLIEYAGSLVK